MHHGADSSPIPKITVATRYATGQPEEKTAHRAVDGGGEKGNAEMAGVAGSCTGRTNCERSQVSRQTWAR